MGEFEARDEVGGLPPVEAQRRGPKTGEDHLEVRGIHVVGDAQKAVAPHLGPAPQFRGNELTVGEQGMGVQVDHQSGFLFSVFCFR
jgi:hypothetical protein